MKAFYAGVKVALDDGQKHVATERHIDLATDLEANVKIRVGAAHKAKWNPSGYWTGNDVYEQLKHAITLFEVLASGLQGPLPIWQLHWPQ